MNIPQKESNLLFSVFQISQLKDSESIMLSNCKLKATGMPLWEFRELAMAKTKRKRRANQNIRRRLKQQDRREWT